MSGYCGYRRGSAERYTWVDGVEIGESYVDRGGGGLDYIRGGGRKGRKGVVVVFRMDRWMLGEGVRVSGIEVRMLEKGFWKYSCKWDGIGGWNVGWLD